MTEQEQKKQVQRISELINKSSKKKYFISTDEFRDQNNIPTDQKAAQMMFALGSMFKIAFEDNTSVAIPDENGNIFADIHRCLTNRLGVELTVIFREGFTERDSITFDKLPNLGVGMTLQKVKED